MAVGYALLQPKADDKLTWASVVHLTASKDAMNVPPQHPDQALLMSKEP